MPENTIQPHKDKLLKTILPPNMVRSSRLQITLRPFFLFYFKSNMTTSKLLKMLLLKTVNKNTISQRANFFKKKKKPLALLKLVVSHFYKDFIKTPNQGCLAGSVGGLCDS